MFTQTYAWGHHPDAARRRQLEDEEPVGSRPRLGNGPPPPFGTTLELQGHLLGAGIESVAGCDSPRSDVSIVGSFEYDLTIVALEVRDDHYIVDPADGFDRFVASGVECMRVEVKVCANRIIDVPVDQVVAVARVVVTADHLPLVRVVGYEEIDSCDPSIVPELSSDG